MDKTNAMFKQMRRSPDPQQRAIGNFELSFWLGNRLDKLLEAARTPEHREAVAGMIRELAEHSTPLEPVAPTHS